jgi:hypothetical protein
MVIISILYNICINFTDFKNITSIIKIPINYVSSKVFSKFLQLLYHLPDVHLTYNTLNIQEKDIMHKLDLSLHWNPQGCNGLLFFLTNLVTTVFTSFQLLSFWGMGNSEVCLFLNIHHDCMVKLPNLKHMK